MKRAVAIAVPFLVLTSLAGQAEWSGPLHKSGNYELPWLGEVLRPGERVVRVEEYLPPGYKVAVCSASDSLGGRVLRVTAVADSVRVERICHWFASEHSWPHDYIRVFDSIPISEAREAVEAVAPPVKEIGSALVEL